MNQLEFLDLSGEPLELSDDERVALCAGEYAPWSVRWRVPSDKPLYVAVGGRCEELRRDAEGMHWLPTERWRKKKGLRSAGPAAGVLRLWGSPDCSGAPLTPVLVIEPTLPRELHRALLRDLGRLLIGISTCIVLRSDAGAFSIDGRPLSQLDRLLLRAQELSEVAEMVDDHLPLIEANPSRRLARHTEILSESVVERRGLRSLPGPARPGTERVRLITETTETPEAEFINAMRHDLADEADLVRSALLGEFRALRGWLTDDRGRSSLSPVESLHDEVASLAERLGAASTRHPDTSRPERSPETGNLLLQSPEYGPPARAWLTYLERWPSNLRAGEGVFRLLREEAVAPTASLFERWMVVRLYASLLEAGFMPEAGSDFVGALDVKGSELTIPRGATWVLSMPEGPRVRLVAEPELRVGTRKLTPDALLEVSTARGGSSRRYVFDAKFRDYHSQDRQIEMYENGDREGEPYLYSEAQHYGGYAAADRLGTMRDKYLHIDRVVAGFIIHPDRRPEYEVWDDAFDRQEPAASVDGRPHRAVSVPWAPGWSKLGMEVTKVLTCIFGFHEGIRDTCWRCGVKGDSADEEMREVTRRSVGHAYRCPSCTAFWVDTWCHRDHQRHRPLLKMGLRSFHRIRRENPYDVACPWCAAMLKDWSPADFLTEPRPTQDESPEEPF